MRIPNFKRPRREDMPDADDTLFKKIVEPISDQVEELTRAMQRRLSPQDNFDMEVRELDLTDGVQLEITLRQLRGIPLGALFLESDVADGATLAMERVSRERVKLRADWPSGPSGAQRTKVLIVGGL